MIQLPSEDLARVLGNAMKFVNPKSIWVNNLLVVLTTYDITCYGCDGYFALADRAFLNNGQVTRGGEIKTFALPLEDVKDLEKFARENKKTDITIEFKKFGDNENSVYFTVNGNGNVYDPEEVSENWDLVDYLLFEDLPETNVSRVEFSPERFTKLSQLKHDKDTPMAWKFIKDDDDRIYVRFKISPFITGFIAALKSDALDPNHLWEGNE